MCKILSTFQSLKREAAYLAPPYLTTKEQSLSEFQSLKREAAYLAITQEEQDFDEQSVSIPQAGSGLFSLTMDVDPKAVEVGFNPSSGKRPI